MIFPWMFDEIHALRQFKDAANLLAEKEDWPPLYDVATLNNNKVCFLYVHLIPVNLYLEVFSRCCLNSIVFAKICSIFFSFNILLFKCYGLSSRSASPSYPILLIEPTYEPKTSPLL